jgi:chromosome partitioning protein
MAKTIAVMMYKGGSGKTTTTTNLAAALHSLGKRTLLIDLDRQGNATTGIGFDLNDLPAGINDLFANPNLDPLSVVLEADFGLKLMAANRGLAKTAMNMSPGDMFRLREIITSLNDAFDFIVIDTPPNEGYMTYNALAAADEILIPVATQGFSEEGLSQTIDGITQARKSYNPNLKLGGILFTKVEPRTLVASSVLKSIQDDHPGVVIPFAIPKAATLDKGNLVGIPAVIIDPSHPASERYLQLARRFTGDVVES